MDFLNKPITELKGVGNVRAKQLNKLGVFTVNDLIHLFPRAYEMRGNIKSLSSVPFDRPSATILTVGTAVKNAKLKSGISISKFRAFDDSGSVEIVFFNSPFVKDVFKIGSEFRFYGKFSYSKNGQLILSSPKYEPYIASVPLSDLIPIYPLTEGLSSKFVEKLLVSVIDEAVSQIRDPLIEEYRLKYSLASLSYAIKKAHFPDTEDELSKSMSRLAFDEMLMFGIGISLQSRYKNKGVGVPFSNVKLDPFLNLLPFELTDDQKKAVNDIYRDTVIKNSNGEVHPMARILVGDVGSGKTVCALLAIYLAVKSGYQASLMVPTEILARQHFAEASEIFSKLGITTELLLGNTSLKEKKRIYESLNLGTADVVIGTHALLSDKVEFNKLGLIITDEQHRFGVNQRSVLKDKCKSAHMLVMSATPIPRSLALTMYGDLDISKINTMPSGRMRVDTFVVDESYRSRLNDFIKKQVLLGGQCYVVCPSIEAKDDEEIGVSPTAILDPFGDQGIPELKNAVEYTEELKSNLPDLSICCLHGKMKASEKDEIMNRFANGEIDVLVSTTVIEVGINVPNASLMIVENAERFGLSQLHQLRGRVGRGKRKSYCVLVSDHKSENSVERLNTMKSTYDGYAIAEKDLLMRGPGDFFSNNSVNNLRQSGGFDFKFANLCNDSELMNSAFALARSIVSKDPSLSLPEHSYYAEKLNCIIDLNISNIS